MSETVRSFVAVNIPSALREEIGGFFADLRTRVRGVRWVAPDNLHLTLKFLGEVERTRLPEVEEALEASRAGRGPFPVTLTGTGVFPPRGRPRVVWLDVTEGGPELTALQGGVERALAPLGFPPEGRPFTPHLTVGRVKDPRHASALLTALEDVKERLWGGFTASTLDLVRSELFPTGARYSILREIRL
jgi:2'-5' RNA ligase